jgi:tol-pal system protein YbgF
MWRKLVLLVIGLSLIGLTGCAARKVSLEDEPLYPITQELKEDIARLEQNIEQLSTETSDLSKRTSNLDSRISLLNQEVKSSAGAPSTAPKPTTSSKPASGNVQVIYNEALENHHNRKFDWAIDKFSQLIRQYSQSALADNSQYWLAECYYGLEDFPKAIEEFQKVFSYADTEKDDDAQLKLGFCYASMGNATQAVAEFRKLLNLYPDSEYADTAKQKINELSP